MDDIIIDPDKLDLFAVWIEQYCRKQEAVFRDYISHISSIANDWEDEKTFGPVFETLNTLSKNFTEITDRIKVLYPRHFRERAKEIRNRPK